MSEVYFTLTGAQEAVAMLTGARKKVGPALDKLVNHHGMLLRTRVMAKASGRPGPRAITGDYRRSWQHKHTGGGSMSRSEVGTNAVQGRRLEYGFNGSDSLGRVYCADMETKALTQRGWLSGDEITIGDQIMTLNPDTWMSEFQPVLAVNKFADQSVAVVEARTLSQATTDDHRWLVERYYARKKMWVREWRTTKDMPPNVRVPLAAPRQDLPVHATVEDAVVEMVGWFWTEGSYGWRTGKAREHGPTYANISQSNRANPDKCARIDAALLRLFGPPAPFAAGGHWHCRERGDGVRTYTLDRAAVWLLARAVSSPDKELRPEWLCTLTQGQLDLLIDVSMAADGHVDKSGVARLCQANEDRADSWAMALALAGKAPVTRRIERARGGVEWATTTLRTAYSHGFGSALRKDRGHSSVQHRRADVWCPTTANGTWLARRNGTVYFTGNSQPPFPHARPAFDETAPGFEAGGVALIAGLFK